MQRAHLLGIVLVAAWAAGPAPAQSLDPPQMQSLARQIENDANVVLDGALDRQSELGRDRGLIQSLRRFLSTLQIFQDDLGRSAGRYELLSSDLTRLMDQADAIGREVVSQAGLGTLREDWDHARLRLK